MATATQLGSGTSSLPSSSTLPAADMADTSEATPAAPSEPEAASAASGVHSVSTGASLCGSVSAGVAPTSEAAASAPPSEVEDASAPASSASEVGAPEASAATGSVLSSMKIGPLIGSELRATGRAKGSKGAGMAQKLLDLARLAHDWIWRGQEEDIHF